MSVALERAIRAYVARGTSLPYSNVIRSEDNKPRPKDRYATLLLINDVRQGYPQRIRLANGEMRSWNHRTATYSLQFYRTGANETALAFCDYAESENGLVDAVDTSIRIVQPIQADNLAGDIVGDAIEERALINLPVQYVHYSDQDAGTIDQINYTIDYDGIVGSGTHGP